MKRKIFERRTNKHTGQYEVKSACVSCKSVRWTPYSNFKQSRTGLCWKCRKSTEYLTLGKKWRGKLTPVAIVGRKGQRCVYKFMCDCGGTVESVAHACIKSCGCLRREPRLKSRKSDYSVALTMLWNQYKFSAKSRNMEFSLTRQQFEVLVTSPCHYTGDAPSEREYTAKRKSLKVTAKFNGIDRKNNQEGYTYANTVPCSPTANRAKDTMGYTDFIAWIKRAAGHVSKIA